MELPMTKELAFMQDPRSGHPVYTVAMDFLHVWRINGQVPDDAELQERPHARALRSPTAVNDLRELTNSMHPAFR
jgi:hypothetical protein